MFKGIAKDLIGGRGLFRLPVVYSDGLRRAASSTFNSSPVQISFTDDGQTIVCYHPEPSFPYEHSKPLPKVESKFVENESVLRVDLHKRTEDVMFNQDYSMNELIRLTHVSEMQWKWLPNYTRKRQQKEEYRKTVWDNKDREGI
ncbi:mitochondrial ribosomal protein L42 [Brevipalpus obovatus]|uniref:mitochondrial ribosomal protein L42 n=1 Tax=Brevipalpus obovatus TaxID=246614 RepID=UPI003D9ED2E3